MDERKCRLENALHCVSRIEDTPRYIPTLSVRMLVEELLHALQVSASFNTHTTKALTYNLLHQHQTSISPSSLPVRILRKTFQTLYRHPTIKNLLSILDTEAGEERGENGFKKYQTTFPLFLYVFVSIEDIYALRQLVVLRCRADVCSHHGVYMVCLGELTAVGDNRELIDVCGDV